MALIQCNECGKEISDKAGNCPHCGAPQKVQKTQNGITTTSMVKYDLLKKLIPIPIKLFISIVLVILLKPQLPQEGILSTVGGYTLLAIMFYGVLSFFAFFFRGGRWISGIIISVLALVFLIVMLAFCPNETIKNVLVIAVSFTGFVFDVIRIIMFIGISKKEKNAYKTL